VVAAERRRLAVAQAHRSVIDDPFDVDGEVAHHLFVTKPVRKR
jgi:hypothetical protein